MQPHTDRTERPGASKRHSNPVGFSLRSLIEEERRNQNSRPRRVIDIRSRSVPRRIPYNEQSDNLSEQGTELFFPLRYNNTNVTSPGQTPRIYITNIPRSTNIRSIDHFEHQQNDGPNQPTVLLPPLFTREFSPPLPQHRHPSPLLVPTTTFNSLTPNVSPSTFTSNNIIIDNDSQGYTPVSSNTYMSHDYPLTNQNTSSSTQETQRLNTSYELLETLPLSTRYTQNLLASNTWQEQQTSEGNTANEKMGIPNIFLKLFPIGYITPNLLDYLSVCYICHIEYVQGEVFKRLACLHCFHMRCIDQWLQSHSTCPTCRTPVLDALEQSDLHPRQRSLLNAYRNKAKNKVSISRGSIRQRERVAQHRLGNPNEDNNTTISSILPLRIIDNRRFNRTTVTSPLLCSRYAQHLNRQSSVSSLEQEQRPPLLTLLNNNPLSTPSLQTQEQRQLHERGRSPEQTSSREIWHSYPLHEQYHQSQLQESLPDLDYHIEASSSDNLLQESFNQQQESNVQSQESNSHLQELNCYSQESSRLSQNSNLLIREMLPVTVSSNTFSNNLPQRMTLQNNIDYQSPSIILRSSDSYSTSHQNLPSTVVLLNPYTSHLTANYSYRQQVPSLNASHFHNIYNNE